MTPLGHGPDKTKATGPRCYARLAQVVRERLGLDLTRAGLAEALARCSERSTSCCDEIALLDHAELTSPAFQKIIDAVTVQHSWLFRDPQQLAAACSALRAGGPEPRRVWVPACASGEDAYSILMLCDTIGVSIDLLGTDLNAAAVERARRGSYGPFATRGVPAAQRDLLTGTAPSLQVVPRIRQRAQFRVHNLLEPAPSSSAPGGQWDLIVCRNVLIYFSPSHSTRVLAHLSDALAPGATLVLGASDILAELAPGLVPEEIAGRLVFRRDTEAAAAARRQRPPAPRRSPAVSPAGRDAMQALPIGPAPSRLPEAAISVSVPEEGDEKEAVSLLLEGIALHLAGELQSGVNKLRAALYLMPGLWPASYYLALSYEALGRGEEARREYAHVSHCIEGSKPLPAIGGYDFSFLQWDIAEVARRRARQGG